MLKIFLRIQNIFKANKSQAAMFISLDWNSGTISIRFPDCKHAVSEQVSTLEQWLRNFYSRDIMGSRMDLGLTWLQMAFRYSSDNPRTW